MTSNPPAHHLQKSVSGDVVATKQHAQGGQEEEEDEVVVLEHKEPHHHTVDADAVDPAVVEHALSQLTVEEKEACARFSYRYTMLANAGTPDTELRDWLVRDDFCRFLRLLSPGNPTKALQHMRTALVGRIEKDIETIRQCFHQQDDKSLAYQQQIRDYLVGPEKKGRMFVRGYDRQGRVFYHVIVRNTPPSSKSTPNDVALHAYNFIMGKSLACTERNTGSSGRQHEQQSLLMDYNISVDATGYRLWHVPPKLCLDMLHMVRYGVPGRLHCLYMVNCPSLARTVWNMIKGFLAADIRNRIKFVSGEKECIKVFGAIMDKDQAMPYQLPDGALTEEVDMEKFFHLPVDQAYDEILEK